MARGRKGKDNGLRLVGANAIPDNPKQDIEYPEPALQLSDVQHEHFRFVCRRILAAYPEMELDPLRILVTLAAKDMAEIEVLEEDVTAEGRFYWAVTKASGRLKKVNPAVGKLEEAKRRLQSVVGDLNLNMQSLVSAGFGKKKPSNPFGQFGK